MMKKILVAIVIAILLFIIYLILMKPSHNKNWREDLTILPQAEMIGSVAKIRNVRDWRYNENGPTSKEWVNKEYDINKLSAVWFIVEPFSNFEGVAHTMFSFDFDDEESVIVSVEARKEVGEDYSALAGVLNKYELIYVWSTETDSIARRIVTQSDDLYMYPLDINLEYAKILFIDLINETNSIYEKPQFYNTLTKNCTNSLANSANRAKPKTVPWNKARILPGYSANFLNKLGYIKGNLSLEELKSKYYINDIVKKISNYDNFSKELRAGLI